MEVIHVFAIPYGYIEYFMDDFITFCRNYRHYKAEAWLARGTYCFIRVFVIPVLSKALFKVRFHLHRLPNIVCKCTLDND